MHQLEDRTDKLSKEVNSLSSLLTDAEEEKKRLLMEANQVSHGFSSVCLFIILSPAFNFVSFSINVMVHFSKPAFNANTHTQVKELLKREVEKGDQEAKRNTAIIADYKNICSQLSDRLDKEQAANAQTINSYKVCTYITYFNLWCVCVRACMYARPPTHCYS